MPNVSTIIRPEKICYRDIIIPADKVLLKEQLPRVEGGSEGVFTPFTGISQHIEKPQVIRPQTPHPEKIFHS
jgi:hypothetical protein